MKECFLCSQRRCRINLINKLFSEKIVFPLIDYLKDPVVIIKRDGRIIEVNTSFSGLINMKKEDIIQRDYHDFEPMNSLEGSITKCLMQNAEQAEQIRFRGQIFNATIMPITISDEPSRVSVVFDNISMYVQIEKELLKRNKELIVINTLSTAFISSANINVVFDDLLEKATLVSDLDIGWLVLMEDNEYTVKSMYGVSLEFKNKLIEGSLNYLHEKLSNPVYPLYILEQSEMTEDLKKEGIVFLASVPLKVGEEAIGLLLLASRVDIMFDFDIASILSLIGNNISLIAEKIRLFEKAQRLSITDSLTGLYNVRYFYSSLNAEIARAKRYFTPFSIILFDIDNFKKINDTYGHQIGDDILYSLAVILKDTIRKSDIVARYGGEEFIIILPNTSKHEASNLAERIKDIVEESSFLDNEAIKVTISGGIATFSEDAEDAKSLLYAADMAMYKAKLAGKNQVRCFRKAL